MLKTSEMAIPCFDFQTFFSPKKKRGEKKNTQFRVFLFARIWDIGNLGHSTMSIIDDVIDKMSKYPLKTVT